MSAYKVLIAEDKMVIRYGISSCINWLQEGFELAGEASNGAAALQLIRENPVDILITDIRLPVMDGFELVRHAKVLRPAIKVIFICSYSDFAYAREAVKLGVAVDYLLKLTMDPSALMRILAACRNLLDNEAKAEREAHHHVPQGENAQRKELEHLVKRLLLGQSAPPDQLPGWMLEPLMVAVWNLDDDDEHFHSGGLDRLMQIERAYEVLSNWSEDGVAVVTGESELVTVFPDRKRRSGTEIERCHQHLQQTVHQTFTVGVSPVVSPYDALDSACKWARLALDRAFFDGRGKCYAGITPSVSINAGTSVKEEGADRVERFSQALASSDLEGGRRILEEAYSHWASKELPKADVIMQAQGLLTVISSRLAALQQEEDTAARTLEHLQSILHAQSLGAIQAILAEQFRQLRESEPIPVVTPADAGSAHAVRLAISYIQEHYRGELSLQEVAEHVHMSKNYFSEQFKRLTGQNFIDYVIQLRIQHAKRLLRTTGLRVYDVGQQTGFRSSKHFMKLFKRETACTPAEYRMRALQQVGQTIV